MLKKNDFVGGRTGMSFMDDEPLIDQTLEGMLIDGQNVVDLFYLSDAYVDLRIDFGGGVMGITCRDVVDASNEDGYVLRTQLGLSNTKQHNALCKEIIDMCYEEVKRSAHLFQQEKL